MLAAVPHRLPGLLGLTSCTCMPLDDALDLTRFAGRRPLRRGVLTLQPGNMQLCSPPTAGAAGALNVTATPQPAVLQTCAPHICHPLFLQA